MAVQVYTFKISYEGCDKKIWRIFEVSSNYDLARLGYMVLSSFGTKAYHLFNIEYKDVIYETDIENYGQFYLLRDTKLAELKIKIGDHLHMIYDFGTEQHFDIELINITAMPKGTGRSYPRVIEGKGRGIIDDMSADELMEIIKSTDQNGKSDFIISTGFGDEMVWDYRKYNIDHDNGLLKGEIDIIKGRL